MRSFILVVASALSIVSGAAQAQTKACNIVVAKQAWTKCSACHANAAGANNAVGPNLAGIVGRVAGTVPGYRYSPAMKKSGVRWTRDKFDAFIAAPQKFMPGNRMPFGGLKDPAQRAALACWLAK
jgi:cytochrome c